MDTKDRLNQVRIDFLLKKAEEQEKAIEHLELSVTFDEHGRVTDAWLMQYDYEIAIRDGLYIRIGDLSYNQMMYERQKKD